MYLFDQNIIAGIKQKNIALAATLDSCGLLLREDDDWHSFAERLNTYAAVYGEFESQLAAHEEVTLFDCFQFRNQDRIPPAIMNEAAAVTRKLYQFAIDWVPGFFISKNIGPLWGGCAITDQEESMTIFLIRKSFAAKPDWFIYSRKELLAHELCHAARMVLDDFHFEEHFAYQTARSRLRRYIGNWFQTKNDALFFLAPTMLLLGAEMFRTFSGRYYPIWPFWIFAGIYPLFLMVRNQIQRHLFHRAVVALTACGCHFSEAVLFRCDSAGIKAIAKMRNSPDLLLANLRKKAETQLNWQVIMYRFFDNGSLLDCNEIQPQAEEIAHECSTE